MNTSEYESIVRMQNLVRQWQETADARAFFLDCYLMMTRNMMAAVELKEFRDPAAVAAFVQHFADYYFAGLQAFEQDAESAPAVWRLAHEAALDHEVTPLQMLLLGVNAHINHDLVLTVVDLLGAEWGELSEDRRADRYFDFCYVNDIISRTVDAVQAQVLEPAMPLIVILDRLMGPLDERMITRLLAHWREAVWKHAVALMEAAGEDEKRQLLSEVEKTALRHADAIRLQDVGATVRELI